MDCKSVNGILLLYHHPLRADAPTITEHLQAFEQHSRFPVWNVNTELGFPKGLHRLNFRVILLHYSLFGYYPYRLSPAYLKYLNASPSTYKIAFFQDEYYFWPQRVSFINNYQINCIYTLIEPRYFSKTYQAYTQPQRIEYTIPGFVANDLVSTAKNITLPDNQRTIDFGYRGRQLPHYMGAGSQEKFTIAADFKKRADPLGLKLDIETDEKKRIYTSWYQFLANCRAVLGVEAGVSIFDLKDEVRPAFEKLINENPDISFSESHQRLLHRYEDNMFYRTISPRHFEAAALRVCQVLFEGHYSGILQPMVHYIPLKKDFSNFNDVIDLFQNSEFRHKITENAYRDLVASGKFSYKQFVNQFDQALIDDAILDSSDIADRAEISQIIDQDLEFRQFIAKTKALQDKPFPGRKQLGFIIKPVLKQYQNFKRRSSNV